MQTMEIRLADGMTLLEIPAGFAQKDRSDEAFSANLLLVDTNMPRILAHFLQTAAREQITRCVQLVALLETEDFLRIGVPGFYRRKFGDLLFYGVAGLLNDNPWDGRETDGGYVISSADGTPIPEFTHSRTQFADFLLAYAILEQNNELKIRIKLQESSNPS